MTDHTEKAHTPEDLTCLFVERVNAGDALGVAAPLPTLIAGELALTATAPRDGAGARAQVARRQGDGSWLRVLDQPEFTAVSG